MTLAAITFERHGRQAIRPNDTYYRFAAQDTLVPVVAAELPQLLPMLPLAFLPSDSGYVLVAVTSLSPGVNLFVAPTTGQWLGDYVPAALRAWPFKMVAPSQGAAPVLCIDEDCGLLAGGGQGTDLFEASGEPAPFVREMVAFLSTIETNRQATQRAVDALAAAGLIQAWALETEKDGAKVPLNGLFRIDEAALNVLAADQLKALGEQGALVIAYAQMFSGNQLAALDKLKPIHAQLTAQAQAPKADELNLDFLKSGDTLSFGNFG